jgi:cytochrome d ubiquinol oxidase subunit II
VRLARSCTAPTFAFLVVATVWGSFALHDVTALGIGVAVLAFLAFGVTWLGLAAKRYRVALLASMLLAACPALLVGTLRFPTLLVADSGYALTAAEAATGAGTFAVLTWFAPPAVLVLLVVQGLTWRAHRRPVDQHSLLHF